MKIVKNFQMKIVIFTAVKNRCMLHGRVFVMILILNNIIENNYMEGSGSATIK